MKFLIRSSDEIFAMSKSKADIESELESITRPLVKHLIKFISYKSSEDSNKWKGEIFTFLHNVSRLKKKNKFPTASFIYNKTLGVNKSSVPVWIDNIRKDYGEFDEGVSENYLQTKIDEYFRWISLELSSKGDIARSDIYNKLDSMKNLK